MAVAGLSNKFKITDEGDVDEYLGVKIEKQDYGSYKLSQPLQIDQILKAMGFNDRTKSKYTPALSGKILHRDLS